MSDRDDVLNYWLNELGPKGWYAGGEALDAEIKSRFQHLWDKADQGKLQWLDDAEGVLAYLIVTDQFSRNMFRGQAKAFSTDEKARDAARKAIDSDWDLVVAEPQRQFFYLPFMHSEVLADQDFGIELFETRMPGTGSGNAEHAKAHREIIHRFGRFPYRNEAFGRETTSAEQAFLDGGGYAEVLRQVQSG